MSEIANTPKPPYYAVIFSSHRTQGDNGYGEMADRMVELAEQQLGFLGIESVKEDLVINSGIQTFVCALQRLSVSTASSLAQ